MLGRRVALLLFALVPTLTACPALVTAGVPLPSGGGASPAPAAPVPAPATWSSTMLASVNAQRAAVGLGALSLCGTLTTAAQRHSDDQASHSNMSHTGSDGSTLGDRATSAAYNGWNALGENVAYGYGSVDSVMVGWMNSSGHRANILSPTYTHVGFGQTASPGGTLYWTQDFGRGGSC